MISYPCVKVNLGLNVLRKRPDGFHDLETLFLPYPGIHDTLEIVAGDDFSHTSADLFTRYSSKQTAQAIREDGKLMITIARAEGVDWNPLEDLTAKAYSLLEKDFKLPPVKIFLEKTSPVGAGLGGGSADAAFALRMLSELFGLGLGDETLAAYAARLGSDCAFFIYCRPMLGEGRGEVLTPFDGLAFEIADGNTFVAGHQLRVYVPDGISVSTREAYSGIVPREASASASEARGGVAEHSGSTKSGSDAAGVCLNACAAGSYPSLREVLALPVGRWRDALVNDFEPTVFAAHPELAALKQRLYDGGAVYAAMSGSGSALFELR